MKKRESEHQTCGSVRSSLSTLARLVTVGSEAVETKNSAHVGRGSHREVISDSTSIRWIEGQAWMKGSTQVNCCGCRYSREAKDAVRLQPNRQCSQMLLQKCGAHGYKRLSAWKAGTSSFALLIRNRINPIFRPHRAGASARNADGIAGKGYGKKRTLPCNRADRDCVARQHHLTRKRADFRMVFRH